MALSDLDFCCIGLTDVTIEPWRECHGFRNALREGKTSLSEISFLAQSDSQSGSCTEGWTKYRTALQYLLFLSRL